MQRFENFLLPHFASKDSTSSKDKLYEHPTFMINQSQDLPRSEVSFKDLQTIDYQVPSFREYDPTSQTSLSANCFTSPVFVQPTSRQLKDQSSPAPAFSTATSGFKKRTRTDNLEQFSDLPSLKQLEESPRLSKRMEEIANAAVDLANSIIVKSRKTVEDAQVKINGGDTKTQLEITGLKLYDLERKVENCLASSRNVLDLNSQFSPRISTILNQSASRCKFKTFDNQSDQVSRGYSSLSPLKSTMNTYRTTARMTAKPRFDETNRSVEYEGQENQKIMILDQMTSRDYWNIESVDRDSLSYTSRNLTLTPKRPVSSLSKQQQQQPSRKLSDSKQYYVLSHQELGTSSDMPSPNLRHINESTSKDNLSDLSDLSIRHSFPLTTQRKGESKGKYEFQTNDTTLPTLENSDLQIQTTKTSKSNLKRSFKPDWSMETTQENIQASYDSNQVGKDAIRKEIESFLMKFESLDKRDSAKQWLKEIIDNRQEQSSNVYIEECQYLKTEGDSNPTPTFIRRSNQSSKDFSRAEPQKSGQKDKSKPQSKLLGEKDFTKIKQYSTNFGSMVKSPKKAVFLRSQKSPSTKEIKGQNQLAFTVIPPASNMQEPKRNHRKSQDQLTQQKVEPRRLSSNQAPQRSHRSYGDLRQAQMSPKSKPPMSSKPPVEFKRKKIEPTNRQRDLGKPTLKDEDRGEKSNMVKSLQYLESLRKDVERSINYIDKSLQDFEDTGSQPNQNNSLDLKLTGQGSESVWGNFIYKEAKSNYFDGEEESKVANLTQDLNSKVRIEADRTSENDEFITEEYSSLHNLE